MSKFNQLLNENTVVDFGLLWRLTVRFHAHLLFAVLFFLLFLWVRFHSFLFFCFFFLFVLFIYNYFIQRFIYNFMLQIKQDNTKKINSQLHKFKKWEVLCMVSENIRKGAPINFSPIT